MDDDRTKAKTSGLWMGIALGSTLGVTVAAALGLGVPAAAARGAAAIDYEELVVAPIAQRDAETGRWSLLADTKLSDGVHAWMVEHIGPIVHAKYPDEQRALRGALWRAMLPDAIEIYVLEVLGPYAGQHRWWLFLRDQHTGAVSREPLELDARFFGMGVAKRPLRMHRVRLDDRAPWQVSLRVYGHNGTLYNAEVALFLEPVRVDGAPMLQQVLSLDTALHWPFEEIGHHAPGGVFAAALSRGGGGQLLYEQWWEHAEHGVARHPSARGRYLRDAAGQPFRFELDEVLDPKSPHGR